VARERGARTVKLELVRIPAGEGEIAALDYEPRRGRGVSLIAGHGYSSSKHNLDFLCGFLAAHGFRVVSLDFQGHKLGASGGVLRSPHDLVTAMLAAVNYARERYGPVLYTLGHSMGALTALRTCAADSALAGAISIATGYGRLAALSAMRGAIVTDLRSSYVEGLTLPELAERTEPLIDAALAGLAGRPVLYVAAQRDMLVNLASARELFERAPEPKTFATIDSDHTSAAEAARSTVLAWLNALHPRGS
jgi:pimeloyl-ACP methyl ester carboxylesterase